MIPSSYDNPPTQPHTTCMIPSLKMKGGGKGEGSEENLRGGGEGEKGRGRDTGEGRKGEGEGARGGEWEGRMMEERWGGDKWKGERR